MAAVAYFISDHGFGHAARSLALLTELLRRDVPVVVVSSVPRWFFEESLEGLDYISTQVDVGVHQKTSVDIDYEATLNRLEQHWNSTPQKVDHLVGELREWFSKVGSEASLRRIVFDITALAPLVADKLGVPSVGISNFTWDWVYGPFVETLPRFQTYIDLHRQAYAKVPYIQFSTSLVLHLAYSEIKGFRCPSYEIPWLVRSASLNRETVRTRLGLGQTQRYCLYSFGGHAFPLDKVQEWEVPPGWSVILVNKALADHNTAEAEKAGKEGVVFLSQTLLDSLHIQYVDLLAAVDLVVCKTGYGIVSDALFTDRPGFIEHESMARAFQENVSCDLVTLDEVLEASPSLWLKADQVVPNTKRSRHAFNGAEQAADRILATQW